MQVSPISGPCTMRHPLIDLCIGRSGVASGFGAAGSQVVMLMWVHDSAKVPMDRSEFTWVCANLARSRSAHAAIPPVLTPWREPRPRGAQAEKCTPSLGPTDDRIGSPAGHRRTDQGDAAWRSVRPPTGECALARQRLMRLIFVPSILRLAISPCWSVMKA